MALLSPSLMSMNPKMSVKPTVPTTPSLLSTATIPAPKTMSSTRITPAIQNNKVTAFQSIQDLAGKAQSIYPTPVPNSTDWSRNVQPAYNPPAPSMTTTARPPVPTMAGNITTPSGTTVNPNTGGIASPIGPLGPGNPVEQANPNAGVNYGPAAPATPAATTATANATPTVPNLSALEKAYQDNLGLTPEELANQEQIDKLNESYKTGYLNAENQAIPLDFITGQQAALEKRALALSEPLEARVARLQAKRMAALEASKFALDRADKSAAAQRDETKPTEVNGNIVRFNPATGKYDTVYSAPAKPAEGFTLGENQARYDANGNLVAERGQSTDPITPYQAAQLEIERQKLNQGKAPSVEATKLIQNSLSALNDIKYLREQVTSQIGSGRALDPKYKAAESNIVDVIGRLRSGGAITEDEAGRFEGLLPKLWETDATRIDKLNRLENLLNGVVGSFANQSGGGQNRGQGDALDQALSAAGFKNVGGDTKIATVTLGSPLAAKNNNPGNLRYIGQAGATPGAGGFAKFDSPEAGVKALIADLEAKKAPGGRLGPNSTLADLVSTYAPPTENDTGLYIRQLSQRLKVSPNTPLSSINTRDLAREIAIKESSSKITYA